MKLALLVTALVFGPLSHGTPVSAPQPRQVSHYAFTGAKGGVQARLEIRELEKKRELWNLFLLALTDFEAMDQDVTDSYYQIAGIHGMPWISWDGVDYITADDLPPERGYCPHSQLLFGTWHRPYMVLFEQKLQEIAFNIADQFPTPTRTAYQEAATQLRLPYWDWAQVISSSQPVLPTALSVERVEVTMPDQTVTEIDNPLFDYNFHPLERSHINATGCFTWAAPLAPHGLMCNETQTTVRKAVEPDVNVSNNAAVDARFAQILSSLRYKVRNALTRWSLFNSVSSSGGCSDFSGTSLENPHDSIHVEMAPGHMVPPAVAAFDPIFWLHHANVDRQLALHQALYPETYIEQCPAGTATWTIQEDEMLDADTPLTPFHRTSDGEWWTSANTRYITDLGYTYPELADNPSNETLVSRVNELYTGPNRPTSANARRQNSNATATPDMEYLLEVEMPRLKGTPFNVLIFLGEVGDDASKWLFEDSFVGNTATLGGGIAQMAKPTKDLVDLTEALAEKIQAGDVVAEDAVEYLLENVKWRLEIADAEISREDIPGVKVSLLTTEVKRATSNKEFDLWVGGFENHGNVDA